MAHMPSSRDEWEPRWRGICSISRFMGIARRLLERAETIGFYPRVLGRGGAPIRRAQPPMRPARYRPRINSAGTTSVAADGRGILSSCANSETPKPGVIWVATRWPRGSPAPIAKPTTARS